MNVILLRRPRVTLAVIFTIAFAVLSLPPILSATPKYAVAAFNTHTVGCKTDGTVVAVGADLADALDVDFWSDIIQVAAGEVYTLGLKDNGTVSATGDNAFGQLNVDTWSDIIQVSAGYRHTLGLKSNGTVVGVGWDDYSQCNVGTWTDIVDVAAGVAHSVGVKSNGTVVAVGNSLYGKLDVGSWSGIIQISAGGQHTVGLKSNGTVVAVGDNEYSQCNVGTWADIVQVAAGIGHTIGLKSNGTIVSKGITLENQLILDTWTDIVQVAAGENWTVGLKSDGTVVAVGSNQYGQCNVGSWTDIGNSSTGQESVSFTTSDLAGTWYGYFGEVDDTFERYSWPYGTFVLDSSGNVTGGTVVTPDGTTVNVTGGLIKIDSQGILGGAVTTVAATMTLRHGKMDQDKTIMSWTDAIGSFYYHSGVLIKAGGSFTTGDLAGTWYGYWGEIASGFDQANWFYGTIILDNAGNAIGGTYYQPDGSIRTIVSGQLGMTDEGILSGTITTSNGSIITLRHGKMDAGKGFLGWSDIDADGYYHNGWLVKSGGTFLSADLAGTWYGYWGQIDPTFTTLDWFYGTIVLDSSGNAIGGTYYPLDGSTRTIVSGQLSMTTEGILSGTVTTSNGSIITLRHGKMHSRKSMLSWTDIDDDGYYHTGWLTKGGGGQVPAVAAMPWINLLLLDE